MDVASDSSGIHVFAVGLGTSLKNPPILYSGSGGATWTMQTSPAISSSLSYDLTGVAVATGKVAFACGGDVRSTPGTGMNGIILMTVNGGFSWLPQTLMVPAGVSSSSSAAMVLSNPTVIPTFFDIQFNRNHNLNSTVWAVGDNLASLTLPLTATSYPVCYSVFVAVMPTGSAGLTSSSAITFTLVPPSNFPATFGTGASATSCGAAFSPTLGIVWDNMMHGWIYGYESILSTHNGGLTWVYETPNALVLATTASKILTMANVPGNY